MGLHKLLKNMEKRPLMYIGDYNIGALRAYLDGYSAGKYESNNIDENDKKFKKFYNWLKKYYEAPNISVGFDSILLFYNGSHKVAIEEFFKLYKQWHKEEFGEDAW